MDFWASVWQGFVGNFMWAIVAIGLTAMIAWLRKKQSPWFPVAMWSMAGFSLIVACILMIKGIQALPEKHVRITTENVERNLKIWMDDFHLGSRTVPTNNEAYFAYVVTFINGDNVIILRSKELPNYITIEGGYRLTSDDQAKLANLDTKSSTDIMLDVQMEMARERMNFAMPLPFQGIRLESRIPITSTLSESEFISSMDDMDNAEALVRATIQKDLVQFSPTPVPMGK